MSWRISIKVVGSQQQEEKLNKSENINLKESPTKSNSQLKDFTVDIDPESSLSTLQNEIERNTGLSINQQRLIYRGRLLNQSDDNRSVKIRDIKGLSNNHTIHLVPRSSPPPTATTSTESSASGAVSSSTSNEDNESGSSVLSGSSTASLLATLLGLGSSNALSTTADPDDDNRDRERRRIQHNRRTLRRSQRASQGIPPRAEPGSLEPCRQGLMTLHTMLNHNQSAERKWYKGQWLDCRDTVNQWLEATVVDIVTPQDILTPAELQTASDLPKAASDLPTESRKRKMPIDADPIINASDYDGRRRLLIDIDENGDAKLRDGTNVQLLLIHYNGWPHRWDEWIRSDSDRIRPFRTRTRHGSMAPYSSPTPQYVFQAAPSTCILTDDQSDRNVILNELSRTFTSVNTLLHSITDPTSLTSTSTQAHLPWLAEEQGAEDKSPDIQQLKALAPLLDRLGRTLTDIAPHIASYAAAIEDSNKLESRDEGEQSSVTHARISSNDNVNEENPEMADYVHGMVNAASRENRRDTLSGGSSGRESEGSSGGSGGILSSIFSGGDDAGALNRLLRVNGNGSDGGIDIHIHAIVTPTPGLAMFGAGGGGTPGLGFAMQPSTNFRPRTSNDVSGSDNEAESNHPPAPTPATDEDDLGLFSDLYSESPADSSNEAAAQEQQQPENNTDENPIEEVLPLLEEVNVNSPLQETNGETASMDLNSSNNNSTTMEIDQSLSPSSRSGEQHDLGQTANSSNRSNDANSSSTRPSNTRSSSSAIFGRIFRRAMGRQDDDE